MNRLRSRTLLVLALAGALTVPIAALAQKTSQSAGVLFESARQKELVEGKLEEAIQMYTRIVKEQAGNRALAAKALLHIGQCHEKLGQAEARSAYERLVRDFADQKETVAEARERLAALGQPASTRRSDLVVRQVWAGRNVDNTGSPSSDGRFLATTDWLTGNIAIRDLASGAMRGVTKTGDVMKSTVFGLRATFSPDDKRIAYGWYDSKAGLFDLWLVGADGTGAHSLYREEKAGYVFPACWTPDGKSIVAVVNMTKGDQSKRIVLVSAESGAVRVMKSSSQAEPTRIGVSPDGRFLVYDLAQADGKRDIFLMSLLDGRETRLVEHPADDRAPIWTPDGRRVLFLSDRTGGAGLWAQEVTDGKALAPPELVKQDVGRMSPMGFTRSGALYYGLNTDVSDVFSATVDLEAGRVTDRPSPVSQRIVAARTLASWSPDGKHLAYLTRRQPAPPGNTITIRAIDSGEERDIHVNASTIRRLGWFPDATALVVPGLDADRKPGVFRIDLKSGAISTLARRENVAITQASVTRDGKSLVYFAYTNNAVVVRDLQTGGEQTITPPSLVVAGLAVSPDGQRLAVVTTDEAKRRQTIVVMPVTGGEMREICHFDKLEAIVGQPAWTPDGRQIVFGGRPQEKIEFMSVSSEGGEPRRSPLPMEGITDFSIHPDGKRIAFSAGQSKSEVWVIENFLPLVKKGT
jgi:Tol biopolymer transport system component